MRKLSRAVLLPVLVATSLFAAPEPPLEVRFEGRPAPLDAKPDPAELTAVPVLSEPLAPQALTGASSSLFVPIVLSSAGVPPSFFTSELTLTNRGEKDASVDLTYTAAFGDGTGTAHTTLAAGRQLTVPDAIEWLRSLGVPLPASGNRGGTLLVRFSGLASPSDGAVSVRTTTSVAEGRAGLAYAGTNLRALPRAPALPDSGSISSLETYRATDYEPAETLPSPAPATAPGAGLSTFEGQDPNGTWSLYLADDASSDAGALDRGWCLVFTLPSGSPAERCSDTRVVIPGTGTGATGGAPASLYPTTISVSGLTGPIQKLVVKLKGLSHSYPDDIDALLAGPGGRNAMILSDVGGGTDVFGDVTLDDAALTLYLGGLRQDDRDRTNVAFVNPGTEGDVVLKLTVHNGSKTAPQTRVLPDERLAPGQFKQLSGLLASTGFTSGWLKVEKTLGSAPLVLYAVTNDQGTSDGSYVPPYDARAARGLRELVIPAVVESGAFTSEVVLTNVNSLSTLQLTLSFVSEKITASSQTATTTLGLAPGEQLVIPSFVQYLRDRGVTGVGPAGTGFAGPLFLSVSSGSSVEGLFAGARTSAPGGAGRYGVFYPAVPPDTSGGAVWVHGLQQDAQNRTNLALVNLSTSTTAQQFKVDFFDGATGLPAGSIANISVPARSWLQIGTVLSQANPGTANAYARVTRTTGSSGFVAYAVLNDGAGPGQRSGDGAFLPAERDCAYSIPASRTHGWSGGPGSASLTAGTGCFWDARSDVSWMSVTSGPDGSGGATVSYRLDANSSAQQRTGMLEVAGRAVTVTQLGNSPGTYDGVWTGTTSQSRPIGFTIDRNEVTSLSLSLNVTLGQCRVEGAFTVEPSPRPVVVGNALSASFSVAGQGGGASISLTSTFSAPKSTSGSFSVPLIIAGSSVCIGFGSGVSFTATRP